MQISLTTYDCTFYDPILNVTEEEKIKNKETNITTSRNGGKAIDKIQHP